MIDLLQIASNVVDNPTDNPLATGGFAVLVAAILQTLKNSEKFPWLSRATGRINFWVAIFAAGLATAGVHLKYDINSGGSLSLPSLTGLFQWAIQWATQQLVYKGAIVPAEALGEIRVMIERFATPPAESEGAAKAKK